MRGSYAAGCCLPRARALRLAGKPCGGIIVNMANGEMISEIAGRARDGAGEAGRNPAEVPSPEPKAWR